MFQQRRIIERLPDRGRGPRREDAAETAVVVTTRVSRQSGLDSILAPGPRLAQGRTPGGRGYDGRTERAGRARQHQRTKRRSQRTSPSHERAGRERGLDLAQPRAAAAVAAKIGLPHEARPPPSPIGFPLLRHTRGGSLEAGVTKRDSSTSGRDSCRGPSRTSAGHGGRIAPLGVSRCTGLIMASHTFRR